MNSKRKGNGRNKLDNIRLIKTDPNQTHGV